MLKKLFALGVAGALAAGTAAADKFTDPIYATPQLPPQFAPPPPAAPPTAPPTAPPAAPAAPVIDRNSGTPFQMTPGVGGGPYTPRHPDDPMNDIFPSMFPEVPNCPPGWVSAEFLYWATRGVIPPPLVTAGPATGAFGTAGLLGQPDTQVLFGGSRTLTQFRPGFRVETGAYFGESHTYGLSARFYFLGSAAEELVGGSDGRSVVNVPQLAAVNGALVQSPLYVGFPGTSFGSVAASTSTNFLGADLNVRRGLIVHEGMRVDLLGGYRYMHLGDTLEVVFDTSTLAAPVARTTGGDALRSGNNFHGLQVGLGGGGRAGRFSYEAQALLALGVTADEVMHDHVRVTTSGGVRTAGTVGTEEVLQAAHFGVVPEVGVKLGWHPWEHVRLTLGYSGLYWSAVRRAQDQFNLTPTIQSQTTAFWAQGFNLGMELRF
jgi:hypothetical protein